MTPDLSALFQFSRDAVLGAEDGRVCFCNEAAVRRLGRDVVGQPLSVLLPAGLPEAAGDSFVAAGELDDRPVQVSVTRTGALTLCVIPEEARAVLPQSSVVNDMRSSLFSMRLAAEHLFAQAEDSPRSDQFSSLFFHSYFTLLRTVTHLDLAQSLHDGTTPTAFTRIDLDQLCREVTGSAAVLTRELRVELRYTPTRLPVTLNADPSLLAQLLLNLLSNSLAHTKAGDCISVALEQKHRAAILSVDDPGSGIAPAAMGSLFTPGAAEDSALPTSGQGLGLYLAQGIAALHGGTLLVESHPGGTAVRVRLPLDSPEVSLLRSERVQREALGVELFLTELADLLPASLYQHSLLD